MKTLKTFYSDSANDSKNLPLLFLKLTLFILVRILLIPIEAWHHASTPKGRYGNLSSRYKEDYKLSLNNRYTQVLK